MILKIHTTISFNCGRPCKYLHFLSLLQCSRKPCWRALQLDIDVIWDLGNVQHCLSSAVVNANVGKLECDTVPSNNRSFSWSPLSEVCHGTPIRRYEIIATFLIYYLGIIYTIYVTIYNIIVETYVFLFIATAVSGVFWTFFGKHDSTPAKEDFNLNKLDHKNGNNLETAEEKKN